jgi:Fe-S cluster biogenesis protein NfuA
MTWIRFTYDEPPAPSIPLQTRDGGRLAVADFYGRSNLVLLFLHGWGCESCRKLIHSFSDATPRLEAQIINVVSSFDQAWSQTSEGLLTLVDDHGSLRQLYAGLLEFDPPGDLMLYVLNSFNVPVRAWVGKEADENDLVESTVAALDYIIIQCPE